MERIDSRAKTLFKVVLFYVTFILLLFGFSFFKNIILEKKFEKVSFGLAGTLAAFIATLIFLKIDKKTYRQINLFFQTKTFIRFFVGVFSGMILMGLVILFIILFSGFKLNVNLKSGVTDFILLTSPFLLLSYMEEFSSRGYAIMSLKEKFGIRTSIITTSILFASSHLLFGWSIQTVLLGPAIMGIIFGLAAIYSNGLAMPTGLHYGVNVTTAAFGINDQSHHLWIMKSSTGQSLENYQQSSLVTILPPIFMLLVGLILMELYIRKKLPLTSYWQ